MNYIENIIVYIKIFKKLRLVTHLIFLKADLSTAFCSQFFSCHIFYREKKIKKVEIVNQLWVLWFIHFDTFFPLTSNNQGHEKQKQLEKKSELLGGAL